MRLSRREFVQATALGSVAGSVSGAGRIPTRVLGKTGARVSILAFGGGSRFGSIKEEEPAVQIVKHALELGVTYIDTSDDYSRGVSEQRIGMALKAHGRKGIFVATKVSNRDPKMTRQIVERSLKNLQLDQLDLLHIHELKNMEDLEQNIEKSGLLDEVMKMKEAKLTRFVGITCHAHPLALKAALERHAFDVTQMALNAATVAIKNGRPGMVPNPEVPEAFENTALPVANRKKMGVIAMKVFCQDALAKQPEATARNLIYYALTLPITAAVVGHPKPEMLEENVRLAAAFKPLPKDEMRKLAQTLSLRNKVALDRYFRHHVDA
ncbi:MAG: aldo/keto reductase [Bryobacteraceae bacterium]